MTHALRTFDTGIARSRAVLAQPPDYWSYSTLKEMALCPLRYCLEHASYPEMWAQHGYPLLPSPSSVFGNVVHGALEMILEALSDAGVASPGTEEATQVLTGLGGLRAVIESETTRQLALLEGNPRLSDDRKRRIHRQLRAQIQDARAQVQTYLSRTQFVPGPPRADRAERKKHVSAKPRRQELADGSHAEVGLVAQGLRLRGRVDLLTVDGARVEIVDYKTGAESPSHEEQLRLYALLWDADEVSNPKHLKAAGLTAAYRDHDMRAEVPNSAELLELSAWVEAEIAVASREAGSRTPTARPSPETCASCGVRQLCPTYWAAVAPRTIPSQEDSWFDFEGVIGEENGQRSWWILNDEGRPQMLLRTAATAPGFVVGDRVRLLGLRRESDPGVVSPIGSMTVTTEVFVFDGTA